MNASQQGPIGLDLNEPSQEHVGEYIPGPSAPTGGSGPAKGQADGGRSSPTEGHGVIRGHQYNLQTKIVPTEHVCLPLYL
ncbi:hypothetical protein AHAS_Ahas12G0157700 [Arachis hypogaea]